MIPKHYPKEKLVGKTAILEENIRNRGGEGLTKGSLVIIKSVVRGRGLTIQAETCPVCGQYAYITGVDRGCLTLLDDFIIDPENLERDELFMEKFVTNVVGKLCRAAYDVGDLVEKKSVTFSLPLDYTLEIYLEDSNGPEDEWIELSVSKNSSVCLTGSTDEVSRMELKEAIERIIRKLYHVPKAQQQEISVETPDGMITAKIIPDLEYPGISLEFCGKDGCPGAILEYSPTVCGVQLRVYGKDEPDGDPIHVIRMN